MDEPREQPPRQEVRAPGLIVAGAQLSPVQEAYGAWATHRLGCEDCRDVDRTCDESTRLHRAWRQQADDALGQVAAPRRPLPEGH